MCTVSSACAEREASEQVNGSLWDRDEYFMRSADSNKTVGEPAAYQSRICCFIAAAAATPVDAAECNIFLPSRASGNFYAVCDRVVNSRAFRATLTVHYTNHINHIRLL